MRTTFIAASNTSTNGVALGNTEDDVRVFKVIIGTPVNAGNVWLYNITNPVNAATTNIGAKITLPTYSTTNINPGLYVLDFGPYGLPLPEGGNVIIDQTMNVSVVWEVAGKDTATL